MAAPNAQEKTLPATPRKLRKAREEGQVANRYPQFTDMVKTLGRVAEYWLSDPQRTVELQSRLGNAYLDLWGKAVKRMAGEEAPAVAEPAPGDKRFADPEWSSNQFFDFLKQVYLVSVEWANRLVHEATYGDRFITTFYGLIDAENKRLMYINAGHNPPLLLRADGTSELLSHGGLPLGAFEDARYSESVAEFHAGDVLVLYTDGVVEAPNSKDDQFGLPRLEELVRAYESERAYDIVQVVISAVYEHTFDMDGPEDDLTVMVIKVK